MKKTILTFTLVLLPLIINAEAIEIDGIYYNLVSKIKEAEVTSNPGKYYGDVFIPESVEYEGITYSVTKIGDSAFSGCSDMTSVTIASTIISIGEYAFNHCTGLKSIVLPSSLRELGNSAFYYCSSLYSVSIPNGITSIGNFTFAGCSSLFSVTIPTSVSSLGHDSFNGCSNLFKITLPDNVSFIGHDAFHSCSSLSTITLPASIKSIEARSFRACSNLLNVSISEGVTSIGVEAFYGCSDLETITIPDSVNSIKTSAFQGCNSLKSISIGSECKKIGNLAFASCPEVTTVYCHTANVPTTSANAFNDSYIDQAILFVPSESVSNYLAAEPWNQFMEVKILDEADPDSLAKKCSVPTISFVDNRFVFNCETEGVEFVSEIKNSDSQSFREKEVSLAPQVTTITVYATRDGYDNSDTATATITWRNGKPVMEGFSSIILEDGDPKGDVNEDGTIDVADIATVISIMAGKGVKE